MPGHTNKNTTKHDAAVGRYLAELHEAVIRILGRRQPWRTPMEKDDIAQNVVEQAFTRIESIMARYPEARVYAAVRTIHAAIGYDRKIRVERGEGAELRRNDDGTRAPRRKVVSAQDRVQADDGSTIGERWEAIADPDADFDDEVVARLDAMREFARLAPGLTELQIKGYFLVDAYGFEVKQAAQRLGCTREHLSRQLNRARKYVAQISAAQVALTA